MQIQKKTDGTELTISLQGRLDTTTAPELEAALKDVTENQLVFDFSELEYISSAGLRILLAAHKRMSVKGKMTVRNINEFVSEVFEVTGFSDILNIE